MFLWVDILYKVILCSFLTTLEADLHFFIWFTMLNNPISFIYCTHFADDSVIWDAFIGNFGGNKIIGIMLSSAQTNQVIFLLQVDLQQDSLNIQYYYDCLQDLGETFGNLILGFAKIWQEIIFWKYVNCFLIECL